MTGEVNRRKLSLVRCNWLFEDWGVVVNSGWESTKRCCVIIINRPGTLLELSRIKHFHKWPWMMFSFVAYFFLCRILSRVQAGASNVWSYWPANSSSIRGLVWMRRPHSGKVVTLHFVTTDKSTAAAPLQASTATGSLLTNRLFAGRSEKDTQDTTTISSQPHGERI